MATLELRLLGGLTIAQAGVPLTALKSQKGLALLCYLALTGKPHARPVLAGLLWPEMPESRALMNLRTVLLRLNRHLAPHLNVTRQSVAFAGDGRCWIDVAAFEAALADRQDLSRLQEAVALYGGDFLEGFYLDDAPAFDAWVLAQRARLREDALGALDDLVTHSAARGDDDQAIAYARRLLEIEPWREEAHRTLMGLLARTGRRSAALVQYEACRAVLAEELGIEPAPETVELVAQIRANGVKVAAPARAAARAPTRPPAPQPVPAAPATALPAHNLPAQPTPLIGRQDELDQLGRLMAAPDRRLITITGTGGIGKTRLALAFATSQVAGPPGLHGFANGVYFLSLAPIERVDQIVPALAQAVGLQLQAGGRRTPKEQVVDFLKQKQLLLVFDNFEHLLEGAGLIADILQAAPGVKVLTTSREPLSLYEEQVYSLDGLSFSATTARVDDPAVQLFVQRAQRVRPDFVPREADIPALTVLCRQTAGLPLALEMAAAWMDALSLDAIARQVSQSLDLLQATWQNVPDRHRNIRAVFEVSWQRLSAEEQSVFAATSVFRGGFTRQAARQVCAPEAERFAFQRILTALVRKSLLQVDSGLGRYNLHELLRQFAAEKLAARGEVERAADRHSVAYCAFLHEHTAHWHTERQLETLALVTREAANVAVAWRWALEQGEWRRLSTALASLSHYYSWNSLFPEGVATFGTIAVQAETAAARQAASGAGVSPDCLLVWAQALARKAEFTPQLTLALEEAQACLTLLTRPELAGRDVRRERAWALIRRGWMLVRLDHAAARPLLEEALLLYQAVGDRPGVVWALTELAHYHWVAGDAAAGLEQAQAALPMAREQGDLRAQAISLRVMGVFHNTQGRLQEAERLQREALRLGRQLGAPHIIISLHHDLALTLLLQGQAAAGQALAERALALSQARGGVPWEGLIRYCLCEPLLHGGHYEAARAQATAAFAAARAVEEREYEAALYGILGQLALVESSYAEAEAAFAMSADIYGRLRYHNIDISLAGLAYAALRLGRPAAARRHLVGALAQALAVSSYFPIVLALPAAALLLAGSGEQQRAAEIWALAKRHPYVANSTWFADVVGRELDALVASLPREVAAAAIERGQGLDLWATAAELLRVMEDQEGEGIANW